MKNAANGVVVGGVLLYNRIEVMQMNSTPLTVETLAVRVTALEKTAAENHESHGAIYARIEGLEKGHAVLDTNLANIWKVLTEIQKDLKDLKERPAKRWDMVVSEAVKWFIIAALGAMVIFE